ncbi:cytochrome P450 [Actinacidiphila acidipaludis]|uniref:Cytochrome P450 n=1 Tax=Actinacidiphila acidipaludis TaxID=2873382 RepID=A0ABS7Q9V3_9ACTN|nr:cytochrome P450 [Streptomyces acidipaludis]MBY8879940.1 cytochrome P450 [Streptomyces acidipaludis]
MTERLTRGFVVTDRQPGCPFDPSQRLTHMARQEEPTRVPVYEPRFGEADTVILSRYADVRAALGDTRLQYGHLPLPAGEPRTFMPGFPPDHHGAEHIRLRRMMAAAFAPKRIRTLGPLVDKVLAERLDVMEAAGPGVDLVAAYAVAVPSIVIGELLGVPASMHQDFHSLSAGVVNFASSPAEYFAHLGKFGAYMKDLVAEIRRHPTDGLITELMEGRSGDIGDAEIVGLTSALVVAGHETTAAMIALGALALLERPDQRALLLDESVSTADAVEELLRYLSISGVFPRVANEDITIGEWPVKAGERVLVSLLTANRDPRLVPDGADRLDLTREPVQHMAFGFGTHQCPGQHLARLELQLALPALFHRFPELRLAVPADELTFHGDGANVYGVEGLPVAW